MIGRAAAAPRDAAAPRLARVARALAELRATVGETSPGDPGPKPLDAALEILRLGARLAGYVRRLPQGRQGLRRVACESGVSDRGSELRLAAELFADPRSALRYDVASWDGIIGRAARSNEAVWVPDITKGAGYIAAESSTRAELAVPIRDTRARRAAGVVNIELPGPVLLTGDDVAWTVSLVAPLSAMLPTTEPTTMVCGYFAGSEKRCGESSRPSRRKAFSAWWWQPTPCRPSTSPTH